MKLRESHFFVERILRTERSEGSTITPDAPEEDGDAVMETSQLKIF